MFPPLAEQSCLTCRYFRSGRCHRQPPQLGPRGEQWPSVDAADWCGEWVMGEAEG
jgi:hypothetical protein